MLRVMDEGGNPLELSLNLKVMGVSYNGHKKVGNVIQILYVRENSN